jgi:hypothetical protein
MSTSVVVLASTVDVPAIAVVPIAAVAKPTFFRKLRRFRDAEVRSSNRFFGIKILRDVIC